MRFIQEPDKVLAEKDPTALALFQRYKEVRMPNLRLGDVDAGQILDYIARESVKAAGTQRSQTEVAQKSTAGQGATGGLSRRSVRTNK
jgi:hypothetical protein